MKGVDLFEISRRNRYNPPPHIPIRHTKLKKIMSLVKGTYTVVLGMAGSGKSAFTDEMFILDPFDDWLKGDKKKPYKWIFRPAEREFYYREAKWMARRMHIMDGIDISVATILNWSNAPRKMTDNDYDSMRSHRDYFKELKSYMTVFEGAATPQRILSEAERFMKNRGTIEKGNTGKDIFIPNDPDEIVIHIWDHHKKLLSPPGYDVKRTIELNTTNVADRLRDVYGMTCVDVCQMNRNIRDPQRIKFQEIEVQENDLEGSSAPWYAADFVLGLISPKKLQMDAYMGRQVLDFKIETDAGPFNKLRGLKLLKNSYGIDDADLAFEFLGQYGHFKTL